MCILLTNGKCIKTWRKHWGLPFEMLCLIIIFFNVEYSGMYQILKVTVSKKHELTAVLCFYYTWIFLFFSFSKSCTKTIGNRIFPYIRMTDAKLLCVLSNRVKNTLKQCLGKFCFFMAVQQQCFNINKIYCVWSL